MKEELGYLSDEQVIVIIPTMIIIMVVVLFFKILLFQRRIELTHQRKREFLQLEKERKRIANDLHDYVANKLIKIQQDLDNSFQKIQDQNLLRSIHNSINDIGNFHDELRYVVEYIYPRELMKQNLKGSFEMLASEMSNGDTKVLCDIDFPLQLTDYQNHQLFRITQEKLSNIIRHIKPRTVAISLYQESDKYGVLAISYEFVGDLNQKSANRLLGKGGRGTYVIKERMKVLKATNSWIHEGGLFQELTRFQIDKL